MPSYAQSTTIACLHMNTRVVMHRSATACRVWAHKRNEVRQPRQQMQVSMLTFMC